jgi:TonB family protein
MKASGFWVFLLLVFFVGFSRPAISGQNDAADGQRKVTNKVQPVYPRLARDLNLAGTVRLEVLVSASGNPKSIEVKGGSPVLAQAAEEALRNWRWERADHDSSELVEFNFKP